MSLKRLGGIILPKTHERYDAIRKDLNRVVYGWDGGSSQIEFFEDIYDAIIIPRYYPVNESIEDHSVEGQPIDIAHNIIPRNDRQRTAISFLINNKTGVLQLEPASGKTVIAIAAISEIKRKAIIIAHKTKLLENWKKEILKFTNLTDDDIGKLSTQNYKKVLQKKIILCTPHVIAYAVKENMINFMQALHSSEIGIGFVDEVHVGIGPEEFSKASLNLRCKRMYGLSATPSRSDGNTDIIHMHVGEVTYIPPEKDELLIPEIHVMKFPFGIFSKYQKYLTWGGKFQLGRYYKQMVKVDNYITQVSKLAHKSYINGRITLLLGERNDCLLELAKKSNIPKEHIGIFIPGSSKEERLSVSDTTDLDEAFLNKKIVFSTYKACRDGNNRKDLDCLIMSTSTSNVEQAGGRILRHLDGKKTPIIFDLVDTEGPSVKTKDGEKVNWFVRNYLNRKKTYIRKDWIFKEYTL